MFCIVLESAKGKPQKYYIYLLKQLFEPQSSSANQSYAFFKKLILHSYFVLFIQKIKISRY